MKWIDYDFVLPQTRTFYISSMAIKVLRKSVHSEKKGAETAPLGVLFGCP